MQEIDAINNEKHTACLFLSYRLQFLFLWLFKMAGDLFPISDDSDVNYSICVGTPTQMLTFLNHTHNLKTVNQHTANTDSRSMTEDNSQPLFTQYAPIPRLDAPKMESGSVTESDSQPLFTQPAVVHNDGNNTDSLEDAVEWLNRRLENSSSPSVWGGFYFETQGGTHLTAYEAFDRYISMR